MTDQSRLWDIEKQLFRRRRVDKWRRSDRLIKIVFTGGRHFDDKHQVDDVMHWLIDKYGVYSGKFIAIAGCAPGLDSLVLDWCMANKMPFMAMFPDWDHFDRPAGNLRNTWMIDYGLPQVCVAFAGGIGTNDMRKKAKKAGLIIHKINPRRPYNPEGK